MPLTNLYTASLTACVTRSKALISAPPTVVFVFILAVLLELEESLQRAPTIRLLENAICRQYYEHEHSSALPDEGMCKTEPIQIKLAHVRGLMSLFDSLPVIIFGSAFGANADKNGRRLAFSLAVLGSICAMIWIYFTCYFWSKVPIEVVWVSAIFRLIGGGPAIAIAMCLTMASDLSSESKTFYRVFSAVLITDLIGPGVAYGTLQHSLWLPYVVCSLSLLVTFPVILYMPETLKVSEDHESASNLESTGATAYLKFLRDWRIFVGLVTIFLAQFRNNTIEILLPYTSVRFGLELGQAATLLSVVSAVNIVVFLILLPALSTQLEKRAGWSITFINISVARVSSAFLAIGAAMLAAAPSVAFVVASLIIYAAGFGVRLSILAVLTTYVNSSKETARLYTLVATTDAIAHMIASPLLQQVWAIALKIGRQWLVLPFLVLMGIFICSFITSCFLADSSSEAEIERSLDPAEESLLPHNTSKNGVGTSLPYTYGECV
ncbi:hypothetical protein BP6252_02872 [Coleophoma cylindrospora]|uniref:Major facilitator superfamily (MFS) profile domain-containing protein n=1 Tax=Coleophoma cylindrospora TaxID=1849047 RepID=A0A3D8SG54_9HELO|nr:hypothetical protein BP6252_02872 [Coleophoma cylindrospora]